MQLELNLWFSARSGNIYGNLNINRKEQVENIDKLLPIDKFCDDGFKRKLITMDEIESFINDPACDHDALYAWSRGGSMIAWNKKHQSASVIFDNTYYELSLGEQRRAHKGMPDLYFRS